MINIPLTDRLARARVCTHDSAMKGALEFRLDWIHV